MKKLLPLFIILLLLAGCAEPPVLEPTPVVLPTLREPTDTQPPTAWPHGIPNPYYYSTTVPKPNTDSDGSFRIAGPAGSVLFAGMACSESAYGDVDGDGRLELVCLAPGRTSGFLTQELYVYGLEDGWPVCKGAAVLYLFGSVLYGQDQFLIEADSQVLYRYDQLVPGEQYGSFQTATTLLPVRLEDGMLRLAGDGTLPEGLDYVSKSSVFGASLSALTVQVRSDAFWQFPGCLVWRKTLEVPEGEVSPDSETIVMAAVSDNGVTVTGSLSWWPQEGGSVTCYSEGVVPVPAQEDYEALARLSFDELQSDLGPYHADIGSGLFIPCWFTRDGKLISASFGGVDVYDLLHSDQVWVHNASCIENLSRWSRFVENAGWGRPDELTLRLDLSSALMGVIGVDTTDVQLPAYGDLLVTYNGKVYEVTPKILLYLSSTPPEAEISRHYSYLITDETEGVSPVKPKIHYLLSNDPDMTYERYMLQALRNTAPSLDLDTMLLFSRDYDD